MAMRAKVINRAAGLQHLQRLMAVGALRLAGVMGAALLANKFVIARRQRMLAFFAFRHEILLSKRGAPSAAAPA